MLWGVIRLEFEQLCLLGNPKIKSLFENDFDTSSFNSVMFKILLTQSFFLIIISILDEN